MVVGCGVVVVAMVKVQKVQKSWWAGIVEEIAALKDTERCLIKPNSTRATDRMTLHTR